jgi:hypothetical protein
MKHAPQPIRKSNGGKKFIQNFATSLHTTRRHIPQESLLVSHCRNIDLSQEV